MEETRTIGIIAGNGAYPKVFIEAARKKCPGVRLIVAAFEGETRDEVVEMADAAEWMRVGQLGKPIKFFNKQGAREAIMVGQIAPKNLFNLRPDLRTLMLLARTKERNAESLFGGIAEELAKDGIHLLPATTFLEDLLPGPGHVFGPELKPRQLEDAEFGFRIAKETSRLDIGQTVVVRHGTVLAVEAFEGTNACIRRGGELGRGKNVMLVKVSKPNQDFRFDVPVVGPQTIETCVEAGVGSIAIEAGRTLLLESETVRDLCDRKGVSLYAVGSDDPDDQAKLRVK
ncbi:UDP-2,3-diacylglucosamine pyrophosphatase [Haloferula helveola]|uniref:UDP-2,3-diacylglucosamine pyrophosphatase n=1 Tax=Haloferula helveola TaxID=490095 RepID=A0ABM7RIE7_9BACT|nr:UDP-2,3-diacylglucosamine pyrophosphatase [Haloferula helveola]